MCFLSSFDSVIYIENGRILGIGSYEHLKDTNSLFKKFINSYLQNFQLNKVLDEKGKNNYLYYVIAYN